ncbi:MAG: GAF domain-containing protein [Pleurocapsa minor GSE-CHR-MK-17-07R]|jgi:PAS domain S-box-containing protein|nr:GAF domain-containing protein [Pleurocapsa minor GSE-CHR-MK 17-07R]
MLDSTSHFQRIEPNRSAQEQLRDILTLITELNTALQSQIAFLRPRGMTLPTGTLERLNDVRQRIETMGRTLTSGQIELRQLRALAQTTALLNSSLDVDAVLNTVMDTVVQLTGAERGFILLKNEATGEIEFRIARGIDREQLGREDFKISNTIIREVLTSGAPVLTDNARADDRFVGNDSIVGYGLRSILAVPLVSNGEVIGVVYCDNRILAGLFKAHEKDLLQAFAGQAAVAIQNARLFASARARLAEITEVRDLMDNVFQSISSGIITFDARGVINAFNPAAEQITGATAADAIGRFLPAILPAFSEVIGGTLEQVVTQNVSQLVEAEINLDQRGWRYWRVVLSPLRDPETGSTGAALVLDDLTETREREAQLAQARVYLPLALVENLRSEDIAAMGGQECEITVLFSDVRGFTSFSERLEPEDLMQIINRYLAVASDAINLSDGLVDKYIGDAVTGLFNTPLNIQADHALRAVRAAIMMRHEVASLHETLPPDQRLLFGVGIHTGLAVLGNVGSAERREFSAIGDAMDMAKLLQENAGRGEIVLSAETWAQVKDYIPCEPVAPRKTKDRADFTVMYRVL